MVRFLFIGFLALAGAFAALGDADIAHAGAARPGAEVITVAHSGHQIAETAAEAPCRCLFEISGDCNQRTIADLKSFDLPYAAHPAGIEHRRHSLVQSRAPTVEPPPPKRA